ncbi:MAG: methylated-DNA--[protein]-cysteine S-methyltransferase, partial [Algoriella sp.]
STEKQVKELESLGDILEKEDDFFEQLETELNDYFEGNLTQFTIPFDFIGTDFQKKVWNELIKIPFGETKSYKEQAIAVGDLLAIRAVANANGKNKIAILVPCHRVIGSDGSLTGYAGGKKRKQFLLELESKQLNLFYQK